MERSTTVKNANDMTGNEEIRKAFTGMERGCSIQMGMKENRGK